MKLGDYFNLVGGGTPSTSKKEYWGEGVPWISSADIDSKGKITIRRQVTKTGIEESTTNVIPRNTVIVVCRVGLGKVALLDVDTCCSQDIQALIPKDNSIQIDSSFLMFQLSSIMQSMKYKGQGTTISGITKKQLSDVPLFLPGYREQQRIVARIEDLFSQLDAGVETLKKTKQQLEVYRQAVLKEAFDEILAESREFSIRDVCNDIKVGIVIKPAQYYTDAEYGVKAFRSANVREFQINDRDWVYLTPEGHEANKRSEIHTGDVLIVRSGYPGTACVVTKDFNNCNAIDILIAVPNKEIVTPEYLCAYTNSPYGRKLVSEKKRGVAQAHLNVSGYSNMRIYVPSIEMQGRVVEKIEMRLSCCEQIEKDIKTASVKTEAMRQSILKQAFEGE